MEIRDFNGDGRWSVEGIRARYREYAERLSIERLRDLQTDEHVEGDAKWVYPLMHEIIDGIETGDPACTALGVDFIEEDKRFSFGPILKSNTARALRRTELTEQQKERVRKRVTTMLERGRIPHEYRQYAKLLRKIGLGDWRPDA